MNYDNYTDDLLLKAGIKKEQLEEIRQLTRRPAQEQYLLNMAIMGCDLCAYRSGCSGSPAIGTGPVNSDLMIVTEQPTYVETGSGMPYISPAAYLLTFLLNKAGIDRGKAYMTYAVKCSASETTGVVASQNEYDKCVKHLANELFIVKPKVILTFGDKADVAVIRAYQETKITAKIINAFNVQYLFTSEGTKQENYKADIWTKIKEAKEALS